MNPAGSLKVRLPTGEVFALPIHPDERSLAGMLSAAGLSLNTRCGQRGLCRGCEVELIEGSLTVDGATVAAPAIVKACQARRDGHGTIRIPARSRVEHRPQVGETFAIGIPYAHQPLFTPVPGGRDTGFAVDIGTTTVVVLCVDLVTGAILSRAGGFNEQIRFGDNVITRIEAAAKPENLAAMQRAIVHETIRPLLLQAAERAGRALERFAGGAVAGNTTMLHLLVGEDPTSLGSAPFTPRFLSGRQVLAGELQLIVDGLSPELPLQLLPGITGYIGADIAAGVIATGMAYDEVPSLLVDIGTNGEILLQSNGQLSACATAAGPAFEGGGLRCGTRAVEGAVSELRLGLNPFGLELKTVGDVPAGRAGGICGSAYLDFLAMGRSSGLLSSKGRFEPAAWEQVPEPYRHQEDRERALRLPAGRPGGLTISEVDVALLLQAKAAIGAGIETLLETAGIRAADLGRVYLAGGFGMHLNLGHAIACGLLPGLRREQIRVVGNTALAGALLALVDRTTLEEMATLQARVEIIELNLVPGFEDCFIEHLSLP